MDPFDQAGGAPQDTALARRLHAAGRLPLDALQGLLREARADRPGGLTLGDLLVTRGLLPAAELAGWLGDAPAPLAHDPGATRTSVGPPEGLEDHPDARPEDTALARRLHAAGRLPVDLLRGLLAQVRAARDRDGDSLGDVLVARGHLVPDEVARYSLDGGAGQRPAPAAPGLRLGDYRVLEAIGAGGMGQVHLVEHVTTGARYALKTLPVSARDDLRERFRREAQAMAAVDQHPGVAKVHAFGEAEGQLYYVMDLVTGGDLDARLRARGRLPAREAAALVRDLALALAHVHARGILHRDLKPANVLFDERGRAKVVDFGLARLAGADALTRTGMTLGTPSYMPPEQVEGRRDEVDARSDVYGLGAVLYHALSGQPPFLGPSAMNTLSLVLRERPRPVRELAPDVPAGLEAVCLRALEKRPVDRFCTADDLARALAPFAAGEDAPAPPRRRHLALLAGLALLLVAAGLAARLVAGDPLRAHLAAGRFAEAWAAARAAPPGPGRVALEARVLEAAAARGEALLADRRPDDAAALLAPLASDVATPGGLATGDGAAARALVALARARAAQGQGDEARRLAALLAGPARAAALRACLARDLARAPARDALEAYRPGDLAPLDAAEAARAVDLLLADPPRPAQALAWAEAAPAGGDRALLVARCALARPDGAGAALEALRPLVAGEAPPPAALDLALEALLALDDARAAAAWARLVDALPRATPGAAALRAACALAQGEWKAALVGPPLVEAGLAARLRACARLGAGEPAAHVLRDLGPPPPDGPDPAALERAGARLVAMTERPAMAPAALVAHAAEAAAGAAALGRLGRAGQEAAARVQAAVLAVERPLLAESRRSDAGARLAPALGRLAALRADGPDAGRLLVLAAWAAWDGGGALPSDRDLEALRARQDALPADARLVLDLLDALASGARGRPDRVLALADRLAQRPPFADTTGTAPLRLEACVTEAAAAAAAAWTAREAALRGGLRARARAALEAARALEGAREPLLALLEAHAALACGEGWDARRWLQQVAERGRGPAWHLVQAECVLLDGDAAAARAVLGRLAGARDDLHARRACQEAIVAALEGDAAARDEALARAAALEARVAEGDQDLPGRLLPWRTAAETRRALDRGWPPPGGVPFHPPGE